MKRTLNLIECPTLGFRFGARASTTGIVGFNTCRNVGQSRVVVTKSSKLLKEIGPILFAVFSYQFFRLCRSPILLVVGELAGCRA